ncbi:hypothetical protein MGYG_02200 [Nannizzia gypsea CBS 118893]|uniref:Uncharacterized protein n=1 Tax=Arthroderma gypseum (strain ATCC MYA-4604 / CBS 118893) TaxID=535722 RepID=E4UQA5_ARTGP|nr:hypothetical protein MGYG_02200 [Nannizzia gypsea CBS 118893]EFQ99186.1 hypothetical protein MGYG_02200 [Nannizzia gypsea CBS 118893]
MPQNSSEISRREQKPSRLLMSTLQFSNVGQDCSCRASGFWILRNLSSIDLPQIVSRFENGLRYHNSDWTNALQLHGVPLNLFPVDKGAEHRKGGIGKISCGLLKLGDVVAEAKYNNMRTVITKPTRKKGPRWGSPTFCDALLPLSTFAPLVSPPNYDASPLYVMSFVTRSAGYARSKTKFKFEALVGLTEEYLFQFYFGLHDDVDIIDTQQEYWYDWGCFGTHLYLYQDLFPWDCIEANGRHPANCGDCNLLKHYPPKIDQRTVSDRYWIRNRLLTLCANGKLSHSAVSMCKNPAFRRCTEWLHTQTDPAMDRLKLGGIQRAQSFSRYYDQGQYKYFFAAPWAHLSLDNLIEQYELSRDYRANLCDVDEVEAGSIGSGAEDGRNSKLVYKFQDIVTYILNERLYPVKILVSRYTWDDKNPGTHPYTVSKPTTVYRYAEALPYTPRSTWAVGPSSDKS